MPSLESICTPLLSWYEKNARTLPFRDDPTPYHVWLSEIMLQQTRVEAVLPYYRRFLEELPDVHALAKASEERLLKLWEGLGYYNRVRNLQRAAKIIVEEYGGVFPREPKALCALPGIGDYTAGAVASIAFGMPEPAVDGNVLRVISRLTASSENIDLPEVKKRIRAEVSGIIPPDRPGDFNQALMELGATVCLPNGAPKCLLCPLSGQCAAFSQGLTGELPVRSEKKKRKTEEHTVFLLICHAEGEPCLALCRREEKGVLSGMWSLPTAPGDLTREEVLRVLEGWGLSPLSLSPLPKAKHIFTHLEWKLTGFLVHVEKRIPSFSWVSGKELKEGYSLPAAFRQWDFPL